MGLRRKRKTAGRSERSIASRPAPTPASIDRITSLAAVILLVLSMAIVSYVRLRLAEVPLERDEGEYAYAGQLILQGIPPYELVYNMKFPGTYYAYAAVMSVFGQSVWGIRIGLLCVHLATVAFVFLIGRRLAGTLTGAVGASAFALMALDRWSMGVFAHATHFIALPAAAGFFVLLLATQSGRAWQFVATGALMGLAVLMKQHAAGFAVAAVSLAAWSARTQGSDWRTALRPALLVTSGVGLSFGGLVALLAFEGVLDRFWFWTYSYAAAYVSQIPLSAADDMLRLSWSYITQANIWYWYAALTGLAVLIFSRWARDARVFLLAWTVAAALAVVPGFFFRQHYFIVLMPVAGLLIGVVVAAIDRNLARLVGALPARLAALALYALFAGAHVSHDARYLFSMGQVELMRSLYATNPFLESQEIARYLKAHTGPDDRIVVLGSEPQLFFHAERKSATGYIYTYPLMEAQPYAARMQDEFRTEVEAARPRYLVFVGVPMSWGARPESGTGLLTWANAYTGRCYELVGIADINPAGDAVIRWDAESRNYQPRFQSQVWTFRRKAECG